MQAQPALYTIQSKTRVFFWRCRDGVREGEFSVTRLPRLVAPSRLRSVIPVVVESLRRRVIDCFHLYSSVNHYVVVVSYKRIKSLNIEMVYVTVVSSWCP